MSADSVGAVFTEKTLNIVDLWSLTTLWLIMMISARMLTHSYCQWLIRIPGENRYKFNQILITTGKRLFYSNIGLIFFLFTFFTN